MLPLTRIETSIDTRLGDTPRAIVWSALGRLLVVCADGSVMVDGPHQMSAPIGPEPFGAAWLGELTAIVGDHQAGLIATGALATNPLDSRGSQLVGFGETVGLGIGDRIEIRRPDGSPVRTVASRCGVVRDLAAVTETIWVVVGRTGWAVVDVKFDVAEAIIEWPGCLRVAADPVSARYVIADLAGSLHVTTVGNDADTQQLDGYPDRVRHLGVLPGGSAVIAAADDELTWWHVNESGVVASSPVCVVGHEAPVTALAVGGLGFVASGDADGGVCIWSPHIVDHPVGRFDLGAETVGVGWSRAGDRVAVASVDGRVRVFDVMPGLIA